MSERFLERKRDGEEITQAELDATHEGFTCMCKKCASTRVYFANCLGSSELSGTWGEAALICLDCNHSVNLIEC